jgi:hypothetical protein
MFFKIVCSIALTCCLIWLYYDKSSQPIIGVCISSLALIFAMFKKSDPSVSNPSTFSINSGDNSVNTQSNDSINVNVNKDAK